MTVHASERSDAGGRPGAAAADRRDGAAPYRRVGTLSSTERDEATSQSTYFIQAASEDLLQFGEKEYFLWRLLDGANSVADIQAKFRGQFGTPLTADQFDSFIGQLTECGAVEALKPAEALPKPLGPAIIPSSIERPEAGPPLEVERVRLAVRLLDPSEALRVLDSVCGPLRFYRWLLLPAVVGVLTWFGIDATTAAADTAALPPPQLAAALLGGGLVGLLLAAVVPPLSQAVIARYYGCETPACLIGLRARCIPRLVFADAGWRALPPNQVLTVVAAPCLARLVLSMASIAAWLALYPGRHWPAAAALAFGLVCLTSLALSAAPFAPTQGRRWLATAFGVADPWRAGVGSRGHAVVLSVLWFAATIGFLVIAADAVLQLAPPSWFPRTTGQAIAATALPWLAIIPLATRQWIKGMLAGYGTPRPVYQPLCAFADAPQALDPGSPPLSRDVRRARAAIEGALTAPRRAPGERVNKSTITWAAIIGGCIAIGFVAYPYEAGGYFTLLPYDSSQLNARIQGELTEVLVNEGDTVKPGQILGILSDWQEKYNLAAAKAQLQSAQASLQNLLDQPEWEEVELARKQYEAALARLPYDKAQFERYGALVSNDNVSRANYDQVLSQYQQDQAAAEVARANYDVVRAGPTPDQIEAARAQVRQNTATVAYDEDQLERTRVRATGYGTVVTPNPMLLRGQWFNQGALVFTVEDHRVVQADVQVPETDIDNVRLGGPVRLRLWGGPEKTVIGKSIAVAPDAQSPTSANKQDLQSGTSNVVRVRVEVPNPDGSLHPQTDGYAKLSGYYMPVWRSFGLMLERFFLVEIWSWIP